MATLTVTFPAATPAPSLGYRIKYWPISNPTNITTATSATTTFVATGITGTGFAGTVEAICGGGNYGAPRPFTATV
jgi:hypothetical protein